MTSDDTLLDDTTATTWAPDVSERRQRGGDLYLPPEPPEAWTDEDMSRDCGGEE